MVASLWSKLRTNLPDRKLKLFVVGLGIGFWLCWATSALLLVEGHPLKDAPNCAPVDELGLFWTCTQGKVAAVISGAVNSLLAITLALPIFVLTASADPSMASIAFMGLSFNIIGMTAGMFVLVRSCRRVIEQFLPLQRSANGS